MKKLITACFLVICLFTRANGQAGYQIGDKVADFSLKNVDGKSISMSSITAKGFIVVFTCNTCPVAKAYEQRIIALNKEFAGKGYPVIAINPNDPGTQPGDSFEKMRERAHDKNYQFPYLEDPNHIVTKQFGATRTPHVFVVQKTSKGNIVQYIGAIDNDSKGSNSDKETYVANAVRALLSGSNPPVATTKAIGCTIKWKKG